MKKPFERMYCIKKKKFWFRFNSSEYCPHCKEPIGITWNFN